MCKKSDFFVLPNKLGVRYSIFTFLCPFPHPTFKIKCFTALRHHTECATIYQIHLEQPMKTLLTLGFALLCFSHTLHAKVLTVTGGQKVVYQCGKQKVITQYYSLSDNSLDFVKLKYKHRTYTLPQIVSASGARYSDLHEIEWWTKGDQATFSILYNGPKNEPLLINCKDYQK